MSDLETQINNQKEIQYRFVQCIGTNGKEFDIKMLIERSLASHVKSFCSSLYINDDDENRMARVCSKTQNALHAF